MTTPISEIEARLAKYRNLEVLPYPISETMKRQYEQDVAFLLDYISQIDKENKSLHRRLRKIKRKNAWHTDVFSSPPSLVGSRRTRITDNRPPRP